MDPADEPLMLRVQAGDEPAFEILVRRYQAPLLRVARSKLGPCAAAEDVVQECFLAVYAGRASFKPQFAFRTWLWTILLNLCKRHYARAQRRAMESLHTSDGDCRAEPQTDQTGFDAAIQSEESARLDAALTQLPEVQADAIRLRFHAELTFDEIAATMQCSVSGAKQRVRHGLEALARHLQPVEDRQP